MPNIDPHVTRRGILLGSAACLLPSAALAAAESLVTVHRDPNCGCCSGWVQHLQKAGFPTKVLDANDRDVIKTRLGVPISPPATRRKSRAMSSKGMFRRLR